MSITTTALSEALPERSGGGTGDHDQREGIPESADVTAEGLSASLLLVLRVAPTTSSGR